MADILFQKDIDSCILTFLQTIFMKFDIRLKKKKADVPLDQLTGQNWSPWTGYRIDFDIHL